MTESERPSQRRRTVMYLTALGLVMAAMVAVAVRIIPGVFRDRDPAAGSVVGPRKSIEGPQDRVSLATPSRVKDGADQNAPTPMASIDTVISDLRSARSTRSKDREGEAIHQLQMIVAATPIEGVDALTREVVAQNSESVVDALVTALGDMKSISHVDVTERLCKNVARLHGSAGDNRFVGEVRLYIALIRNLGDAGPEFQDLAPVIEDRAADLVATRREAIGVIGNMKWVSYRIALRILVLDATQDFEVRVAAGRALLAMGTQEGVSTLSEALQECRDDRKRAELFGIVAESPDYQAAYLGVRSFFNPPSGDRELFAEFCIRLARARSASDAAGLASFLVGEARREMASDAIIAGDILQGLGTASAPRVAAALSDDTEIRRVLYEIAVDEKRNGAYVAGCAAGTWAKSARDTGQVLAAMAAFQDFPQEHPSAFQGMLSQGVWSLRNVEDETRRGELRRRYVSSVREALSPDLLT